MELFRKNLKRLIEQKGLTQTKLAELLGIKSQSVNLWVSGKTLPGGARLQVLAKILGVTVNELMYEATTASEPKEDMVMISKQVLEAKDREIEYLKAIIELKKENVNLKNIEAVNNGQ